MKPLAKAFVMGSSWSFRYISSKRSILNREVFSIHVIVFYRTVRLLEPPYRVIGERYSARVACCICPFSGKERW